MPIFLPLLNVINSTIYSYLFKNDVLNADLFADLF